MKFTFRYLATAKEDKHFDDIPKFLVVKTGEDTAEIIAGFASQHKTLGARAGVVAAQVIGAGAYDRYGMVDDWHSTGYKVTTPEAYRGAIQTIFVENAAVVESDPAWPRLIRNPKLR